MTRPAADVTHILSLEVLYFYTYAIKKNRREKTLLFRTCSAERS